MPLTLHPARRSPGTGVHPLARLRRRAGLSQVVAARVTGWSRDSVRSWEQGAPPPLAALRALARAYGVPTSAVASAAGVAAPRLLDRRTWRPGDLPAALRTWREWTGMTQGALADRAGVSTDAVRGWERGRTTPYPAHRRRVEAALGLPPGALEPCLPERPHPDPVQRGVPVASPGVEHWGGTVDTALHGGGGGAGEGPGEVGGVLLAGSEDR